MPMKAIILIIGVALILGLGALWLHAAPQSAPAVPPTAQQPNPPSSPQQQEQSVSPTASSLPRPLAITHTVGIATATPNLIAVGTSSQVTITIQITDPALIPNNINLLRLGVNGSQPTILGQLQPAGSGIYAIQQNFNEPFGFIQLQVSAAFRGTLLRILSNVITIGVGVNAPVGYMVSQDSPSDYGLYGPVASADVAAGGVDTPPDITITLLSNLSALALSNFFNADESGWFSTYQSITTTAISGHQAIVANDLASAVPRAPGLAAYIAQGSTSVLVVTAGGASSQTQFNAILQSLQLP